MNRCCQLDNYAMIIFAIFEKDKMFITKENKIIIHGDQNHKDGLWDVILPEKYLRKYKKLCQNENVIV